VPAPLRLVPHPNIKNLAGQTFGELLVIADSGERNAHRQVLWVCHCSCGREVLRDGSTLIGQKSFSCGHTRNTPEVSAKKGLRQARFGAALRRKYRSYQGAATARGFLFELTFGEYQALAETPCHYCGEPPSSVQRTKYESVLVNGIDRIDNNHGYITGNCVSCCRRCNLMKHEMSVEDFLRQVQQIVEYSIRRKESGCA
jgi:hypothetical protein